MTYPKIKRYTYDYFSFKHFYSCFNNSNSMEAKEANWGGDNHSFPRKKKKPFQIAKVGRTKDLRKADSERTTINQIYQVHALWRQ